MPGFVPPGTDDAHGVREGKVELAQVWQRVRQQQAVVRRDSQSPPRNGEVDEIGGANCGTMSKVSARTTWWPNRSV
jgi:hypothetical protein